MIHRESKDKEIQSKINEVSSIELCKVNLKAAIKRKTKSAPNNCRKVALKFRVV